MSSRMLREWLPEGGVENLSLNSSNIRLDKKTPNPATNMCMERWDDGTVA